MASAYWDNTYDEAFGPPGPHTAKRRKQRHNATVESMDLLLVELKIDAEIMARRNVQHFNRLPRDEQKRLTAKEGAADKEWRARSKNAPPRQEPVVPDPPMPSELPPAKMGARRIVARPSGYSAAYRKSAGFKASQERARLKAESRTDREKREVKPVPPSERTNGLPSHWFLPVKEDA